MNLGKISPGSNSARAFSAYKERVWKASRAGDMVKVRNLQKLILKSRCARLLAIRQVTQLNQGKRTAGIDGKAKLSFKERFDLEQLLKEKVQKWEHLGLREIPIPKKDGTTRILKVPTMQDRAWQCLAKYAISLFAFTFPKRSRANMGFSRQKMSFKCV